MLVIDRLLELAVMGKFAIYTDIDGTLSPIADSPEAAYLFPGAAEELLALSNHGIRVVAISGRAAVDAQRLIGLPTLDYAGNHGFELLNQQGTLVSEEVARAAQSVSSALQDVRDVLGYLPDGVLVEDKTYTGSVHYRLTESPTATAQILRPLLESIAMRRDLMITEGRLVFEIRPRLEINKGVFATNDIRIHGIETAAFLGDDITDLDGFAALKQLTANGELLGSATVGVVAAESPERIFHESDFLVEGVEGLVSVLKELNVRLRAWSKT